MGDTAPQASKKAYVYFANLDGLRAIAALMVVLSHIQLHKGLQGLQNTDWVDFKNLGKVGVTLFFTLSGFLISYLLLEERRGFGNVSFKHFYIRRVLRIWPLYFLVIIIGFFIYPAQGSPKALLLSIFLLPNLAFCLKLLPYIFDPIWSIGVEEQFYLFHPHIFRRKKTEHILYTLLGILVVLVAINLVVRHYRLHSDFMGELNQFLYFTRFDNMMVGAIVAVLYYNTKHQSFSFALQHWFNLLFNRYLQIALLLSLAVFIYFFLKREIGQGDLLIALLAALLMVGLCEPDSSKLILGNKYMVYFGKISYGIYLLHKYPLFLMLYIVKNYLPTASLLWQNIVIYTGTFVLVIALASISYYGFERYFLRIKSRFQKVTQSKPAIQN
ncbi:acyltransferase family protein [Mucilaginibacter psychrotolerans]|uniref:Acyltransferase n=1 Tax=Mucilaginibacter psychrotolerans TaxID=1524096 RepID=A0A4Y8SKZ1_9SPHI|nr:acyltransferase [Mucilaginibacter psychrotolerans]TFF39572.1 acyltransferase [Mucilaginibacter psychrotolerans]